MLVEKIDFSYVSQEKKPFTTHLNSVLQNLKNPSALGIWAYLSSLPEGWIVNKEHLRRHFGLGRDKLDAILKYLIDNKLLEVGQKRLDDGKMGKGYIIVKCGYDFKDDCHQTYPQNKPFTEKPLTVSPHTDLPYTAEPGPGKTAPINKINNINKTKDRETTRKKRSPLSDDFVFDETNKLRCQQKLLSPQVVLAKFKAWAKAGGIQRADWQAEAEIWIARERENAKTMPVTTTSSIKEWGPGHPTWESMNKWRKSHGSEISRDSARSNDMRKVEGYLF